MNFCYPISKLSELTAFNIAYADKLFFELVVDDYGNNSYVNQKISFRQFADYVISAHPIFNHLNDIFNDKTKSSGIDPTTGLENYIYSNDIYISGETYFKNNPISKDNSPYNYLNDFQTVKKEQLEDFINSNSLGNDSIKSDYVCMQYIKNNAGRNQFLNVSNPSYDQSMNSICKFEIPTITDLQNEITSITNNLKPYFYGSSTIELDVNAYVTIIGKVALPRDLSIDNPRLPYYTPEYNVWIGIYDFTNNNFIDIVELHNIDENGIVYFSFQLPIDSYKPFAIAFPFRPADVNEQSNIENPNDLFSKLPINSITVFYYAKPVSYSTSLKYVDFND